MIKTDIPIYLASQSPRRKKLLQQINLEFSVFSVDADEELIPNEKPSEAVLRLAKDKMNHAIEKVNDSIIITADTIVVIDNKILGKPVDQDDAFKILSDLSNNIHEVYTGYCIYNQITKKEILNYEITKVTFNKLSDDDISDYIKSGSPMDKAGAYGIQDDFGAVFIKEINGCYYNVVGLPLSRIYKGLKEII